MCLPMQGLERVKKVVTWSTAHPSERGTARLGCPLEKMASFPPLTLQLLGSHPSRTVSGRLAIGLLVSEASVVFDGRDPFSQSLPGHSSLPRVLLLDSCLARTWERPLFQDFSEDTLTTLNLGADMCRSC